MVARASTHWLREHTEPLRPIYREVLVMSFFINLLALAVPVFILQVYDRVIFHAGLTTLQGLAIGIVIVIAFDHILRQSRSRLMQKAALRIDVGMGKKLFDKVLALPLHDLERRPNAFWLSLFRDIETVRNTLSGPSAVLLTDLPFALLFVALIVIVAQPLVWVLAVILPLFVLLAWRSAATLSKASATERQKGFGRDALLAEVIAGRTTVKALALHDSIRPFWEDRHADTIEQALSRGTKSDRYANIGTALTLCTTLAMTTVGALAIIGGEMTIGSLIAANMLSSRIIGPFNQLVGSWRSFAQFRQSVTRLSEIFDLEEERQEPGITLERPEGDITLDHVVLKYGDEAAPVIDNLRLTIKPHGLVAIMGPNGSGKTTLIKLIQGLYQPTDGRVLIDEADIAQFTRNEIASWMGYVPQDLFLFTGSIRDNIAKGAAEATDDEILEASRKAGLHEYVIDYPDGYATDIGEAGRRMPGGLRQRMTIARAYLGNPPILLMDEPSSNLDREGEASLCVSLQEMAKDHTIIVVTHSSAILAASDQVLVMQKGRVVRAGRPQDVLPQLVSAQATQQPGPEAPRQKPQELPKKPQPIQKQSA